MKITDVKIFATDDTGPSVFVKIETDSGISGFGESTNHFLPNTAAGALADLAPMLIDTDPSRIEDAWQMCYRSRFYRGGPATGSAVSGIDMALWDIKGKVLGVPVYQLLGGKAREKVRVYGHVGGNTPEEAAEQARERVSRGITALRYRAFHRFDSDGRHDHRAGVEDQVAYTAAIREAVGGSVDLILECHGRYDPVWVTRLAEAVAPYRPFYIEDPIRHENPEVWRELRRRIGLPIATGERGHDKWDLKDLIVTNSIDYVRPDICHCGGITEMRKIAALAETYFIDLIPHNNAGPLGSSASVHACIAMPNVELLEAPWVNRAVPETKIVRPYPRVEDGYAFPSEEPGLGIEFDEKKAAEIPMGRSRVPVLRAADGSIRDF